MNVDNCSSQIYLECLQKIIEEIPSRVREQDFESILKVQQSQELLKSTNDNVINPTKQWLDNVWKTFNISKMLEDLTMATEHSDVIWRPTTGEADEKPIIAKALRERKDKLEQEINVLRDQSSALESYLINCSEKCNNQIDKMKIFEEINKIGIYQNN